MSGVDFKKTPDDNLFKFCLGIFFNTFIYIEVLVHLPVSPLIHLSAFFKDLIVVEDRSLFSQSSEILSSLFNISSKNSSKKIDS